jgi:hypothetical protein
MICTVHGEEILTPGPLLQNQYPGLLTLPQAVLTDPDYIGFCSKIS